MKGNKVKFMEFLEIRDVIISYINDVGSLPEVVSGRYVSVKPRNPEAIAEGVEKVYNDFKISLGFFLFIVAIKKLFDFINDIHYDFMWVNIHYIYLQPLL